MALPQATSGDWFLQCSSADPPLSGFGVRNAKTHALDAFWSVDDGEPATEVKGTALHFAGCDFETVVNKTSKTQPRAWIEVPSASVWQGSDGAITIDSAIVDGALQMGSRGKTAAAAESFAA